jgi:hypothetical protein
MNGARYAWQKRDRGTRDFEKFQDVFAWIRSEDISHYKDIGLQNMETKKIVIKNSFSPLR